MTSNPTVESYQKIARKMQEMGDVDGAIEVYGEILRIEKSAKSLCNRGALLIMQGSLHCAKQDLENSLKLDPLLALAWYNLGLVFEKGHNFRDALLCYTRNIQLDPENPDSYNNRGIAHSKIGHSPSLSIRDFTKAIELSDGDDPDPYLNRAISFKSVGKAGDAILDVREAMRIAPKNWHAWKDAKAFLDLLMKEIQK